mmetsp:Transcript_16371/g.18661  ORF Transcript_16371/g.18661 Transcript_16371/m.18661 type:complete len:193 (-) Transcript_16371:424-1002(-)
MSSISTFLLAILLSSAQGGASIATSEDCDDAPSPVIGCTNTATISVTYPDGALGCGDPLTLDQSAKPPVLTASIEQKEDDYYTVLFVDTAESFVHPILHFGATNIPSGDLFMLNVTDANPFSAYRGPFSFGVDPSFSIPVEQLFNYEWIVAKQYSKIDNPPVVAGNIMFNYFAFLEGMNATMIASTYLYTGL